MEKAFARDEAIRFGWRAVRANAGFFAAYLGLWLVADLVFRGIELGLRQSATVPGASFGFAIGLIGRMLSAVIGMGLIAGILKICDGQRPSVADLFLRLPNFWRFFGTSLLAGLIVIGGTLLLIVPGIVLGLKYCLAPYASLDERLLPRAALRRSAELTHGVKDQLLVFLLVLSGLNLLGLLCLVVGVLVTGPVSAVAFVYAYRRLVARHAAGSPAPIAAS